MFLVSTITGGRSLSFLQSASLARIPWLVHGFSTRTEGYSDAYGGALNLGFTKQDSRVAVERNRSAFLKKLRASERGRPWPLVSLRQIHSAIIHCVDDVQEKVLA